MSQADIEQLGLNDGLIIEAPTREELLQEGSFGYSGNGSGKDNSFYGQKHTEETKARISKATKGKNNPRYGKEGTFKGKAHSEESKRKISEKRMGVPAPNGKVITVDGIKYESLKKASIATGVSLYKLRKQLKV